MSREVRRGKSGIDVENPADFSAALCRSLENRRFSPGIARAPFVGMKAIHRTGLQLIASIVMLVFSAGTLAFAPSSMHRACAAKLHDCGKAAKIAPRCCGDRNQDANQAGPVQLREDRSSDSMILTGCVEVATTSAAPVGPLFLRGSQHRHQHNPLSLFAALRL